MNEKENTGGGFLMIRIIGILLLLYTAYRSLHLLSNTLAGDAWFAGIFALAGLDIGLLAWTEFYDKHARGSQSTIAAIMVIVDFVGVALAAVADTVLQMGASGTFVGLESYTQMVPTIAGILIPVVILTNIGGMIAAQMLNPARRVRMARVRAMAHMQETLAEQIEQSAGRYAAAATPQAAQAVADELRASFGASYMPGATGVAEPVNTGNLFEKVIGRRVRRAAVAPAPTAATAAGYTVRRPRRFARVPGATMDKTSPTAFPTLAEPVVVEQPVQPVQPVAQPAPARRGRKPRAAAAATATDPK